eukprot:gnl/MRDRNA2_/MRDRNA2_72566_c0_seq1.p1 gnl/MRDRNA2_/MRDRNA2_72566_c0~~gnl/MRDRNA2_/MRDRNA2_72566_c0_seq1.p1  ORF type:complete len:696 (+),score=86.35 gnl/MRDRNA2_/MRDRNA2_72566_c0_seq1:93-2090(+)
MLAREVQLMSEGINKDGQGLQLHARYVDSVRLAMRTKGSVFVSSLPPAIVAAFIGLGSAMVRRDLTPLDPWWAAAIQHPFAVQIFGIFFGFLITNRVIGAIARWWNGLSAVCRMLQCWYDTQTYILAHVKKDMKCLLLHRARTDLDDETRRYVESRIKQLSEFRKKLVHWFSLLNASALSILRHGEESCMDHVECQVPTIDWLNDEAQKTGGAMSRGISRMATLRAEFTLGSEQNGFLGYFGTITSEEANQLEKVMDKPSLIENWIDEALVMAEGEGLLHMQAPLLGRAHTQLGDGMTAYQEAYRAAAVPYPFPLAQLVSILLHMCIFLMPVVIEKFTNAWMLTPLLSFLVVLSFWGLNSVAMELENPFGEDANDLPMKELCQSYLDKVMEITSVTNIDLSVGSDSVHTYSVLYINDGCVPEANKAPNLFAALPQKWKNPDEKPPEKEPPNPPENEPEPPLALARTTRKQRPRSAGMHGRHIEQGVDRPWTFEHPGVELQNEPIRYQVRSSQYQWLADRPVRRQPMKARPVTARPMSQARPMLSWDRPVPAELHALEAVAAAELVHTSDHCRQKDGFQVNDHKRTHNRTHTVYGVSPVRHDTAPQNDYYNDTYDDQTNYVAVITEGNPAAVAHAPLCRRYPRQQHRHHMHLMSPYGPVYDSDELC